MPEVQILIGRLLVVGKLAVLGTFACINWTGANVALGRSEGPGRGFLPAVLTVTVLPGLYYALKLRRLRQ